MIFTSYGQCRIAQIGLEYRLDCGRQQSWIHDRVTHIASLESCYLNWYSCETMEVSKNWT